MSGLLMLALVIVLAAALSTATDAAGDSSLVELPTRTFGDTGPRVSSTAAAQSRRRGEDATVVPQWEVVSSSPTPVIGPAQTRPHGVFQGFETGSFMKVNGTYYVAINELGLCNDVVWDRTTRAALWSAPNASGPWQRITTLRNSSNMYTQCKLDAGKGLVNGCSWAPTLVYAPSTVNSSRPVWNLFYSACEDTPDPSHPDPAHGKDKPGDGIVHAVSTTDSILGPYVDVPSPIVPGSGVVVPSSHSFTTWTLRNGTYMSFRNNVPAARVLPSGRKDFSVGLERAIANGGKTLGGPWAYDNNTVPFPCGPENPIVSSSSDGQWYYAVYDALEQLPVRQHDRAAARGRSNGGSNIEPSCSDPSKRALCKSKTECDAIGIAWSPDGVTWTATATALLRVQIDGHHPCGQIRTPLGLVAEPEICKGCYSVLWTGYSTLKGTDGAGYTPMCHAVIRQKNENPVQRHESLSQTN